MKCLLGDRVVDFELGRRSVQFVACKNLQDRSSLGLWCLRETQFRNITHWFGVILHLGPPWLRIVNAFVGDEHED